MAAPAAARDKTCSTATAPTRRPSLTPARRPGADAAPPPGRLAADDRLDEDQTQAEGRTRHEQVLGTDDAIGRNVGGTPAPGAGIAAHGVVDRHRDVVGVRARRRARRPAGRRGPAPPRAGRSAHAPTGARQWRWRPRASAAVMPSNSRRTSDSTRAAAVASVGPSHQRSNATPASHGEGRRGQAGRQQAAPAHLTQDRPLAGAAGAIAGKGQCHSSSRIPQR